MRFKNLIENYNEYIKGIKTRKRMIKVFNRINDDIGSDTLYFITILSIVFGFPTLMASILPSIIMGKLGTFLIVCILIIPFINKILDIMSKLTCGSIKNINPLLKNFLHRKIIMRKSVRNDVNKSFNSISKKVDLKYAIKVEKLIKEIRDIKIKEYIKNEPYTPKFLSEVDAKEQVSKNEVKLKEMTIYLLNLATIKELKELNHEKLESFLKEFSLEDQLEITKIIRKKLEEEEIKNETLNNNLKTIKTLKKGEERIQLKSDILSFKKA